MSYGIRSKFYKSKLWKQVKNNIWLKQDCRCALCNKPVYVSGITDYIPKENRIIGIVHHKEYLTEANIEDDSIAIDENNLIGVCKDCHERFHHIDISTRKDYTFDEYGNLVKRD